jgi:hypothetical protein
VNQGDAKRLRSGTDRRGEQRRNAQEGRARQGRGRRVARKKKEAVRTAEPQERKPRTTRCAHNRNATQTQEGEGGEEAEQAGDRDEAPPFLLSLPLSLSLSLSLPRGWVSQMPGPAKLPPFLCDCLGDLGSPPTFFSLSVSRAGFLLSAEVVR